MMGRDRQRTTAAAEVGPTLEEPELLSLLDNADGDHEFRDRSTGLPLNPEMVKKTREFEMQYMEELKVLEDNDPDACMAETGRPPIPTDWVDINKGDSLRPNYRSRLVCQERHVDGEQLMRKTWQRHSLRPLHVKRSNCN